MSILRILFLGIAIFALQGCAPVMLAGAAAGGIVATKATMDGVEAGMNAEGGSANSVIAGTVGALKYVGEMFKLSTYKKASKKKRVVKKKRVAKKSRRKGKSNSNTLSSIAKRKGELETKGIKKITGKKPKNWQVSECNFVNCS